MSKPRIGILLSSPPFQTDENYAGAVRRAGGEPVFIRPGATVDVLDTINGLLISGGGDICPARYGDEQHPKTFDIELDRDEMEYTMIPAARERDLPILGICRGFQAINTVLGGKLVQHVDGHGSTEGLSGKHDIQVMEGTRLAEILGAEGGSVAVNSRHHQAVREPELAPYLIASAYSPDGLIEAIETPGHEWLIGIQCHPERHTEVDPRFALLFEDFIRASS